MRIISALLLCACAAVHAPRGGADEPPASRAAAPETLRAWVDARAGKGAPVHWISEGGVYDYPSGKKLLGMIGFDSSTAIWPDDPDGTVIHLTRKTYAYTDPVSGEVLAEYEGRPVEPIAYPYQLIRYRMRDGRIYGEVEQGVGDQVQRIKSRNGMQVRKLGRGTTAVTASVFLDFPVPGGNRYQAWENYDFFLHSDETVDEPHQLSWQRYGARPPFAGEGNAIYHLLSWRVESHEEFPPALLEWAEKEMPMWLRPPADLEEIRALQAGAAEDGWPQ
ncbi:MAG: DUF1838 family protein [Gammaproteobacteria bacterium]|nr:DUF1838 family protein [Gammaproteobacteria bacterium]MCY4339855.1 DUF1838 family protein [Gammaproteobacteria bacterium]